MDDKSKYDGPIPATFMGIPVVSVDLAGGKDMNAALVLDRSKTNLSPTEFRALLMGDWKPQGYIKPGVLGSRPTFSLEFEVACQIRSAIDTAGHEFNLLCRHDFPYEVIDSIWSTHGTEMRAYQHYHSHGLVRHTQPEGFSRRFLRTNFQTQAGALVLCLSNWASPRCSCGKVFRTWPEIDIVQVVPEPVPLEVRMWVESYRVDPTCLLVMYDWFAERGLDTIAAEILPYRHAVELGHTPPQVMPRSILRSINRHYRPTLVALRGAISFLRQWELGDHNYLADATSVEREYFLPLPPEEEGDKP